jgi:hypothetical protein
VTGYGSYYEATYGPVYPGFTYSTAPGVYPVPRRFISLGKEPGPGQVTAPTYTMPLTAFQPVDRYAYSRDGAWRSAWGHLYGLIQGVRVAEVSAAGPLFADGIGYVLASALGDYWQSVASGTSSVSSSLASPVTAGAGTIVLASGSGFSVNQVISVGAAGSTAEEVRQVTSVTGGTVTLSSALYQAHASGGTVIAWSAYSGIVHNFALLNDGLGAGGAQVTQPPTYTYTDYTGVPASTGARTYAGSCFSDVTIASEATKLAMWDGKFTALASQVAAAVPGASLTEVPPVGAWGSTVAFAGAGTLNAAEVRFALRRRVDPKYLNSNQQDPYDVWRGPLTAGLSFTFGPASDEQELGYYLANTMPSAQVVISNGKSGTLATSVTVQAQTAGFTGAELTDTDFFGYDASVKCVASAALAGPSGGSSPVLVSLQNQVVCY